MTVALGAIDARDSGEILLRTQAGDGECPEVAGVGAIPLAEHAEAVLAYVEAGTPHYFESGSRVSRAAITYARGDDSTVARTSSIASSKLSH